MKKEHRLSRDQRVKLKGDGQDAPYSYAAAGSEGWIRRLDFDGVGYPIVYIEWDKDHWAFNGEPNQWTLEDHFEPVENSMGKDKDREEYEEFLAWKKGKKGKDKAPESSFDLDEKYSEVLSKAKKAAQDADAFLLIAIQSLGDEVPGAYNPIVLNYYKDEAAGLLLECQLAKLGASSYEHLTMVEVRKLLEKEQDR